MDRYRNSKDQPPAQESSYSQPQPQPKSSSSQQQSVPEGGGGSYAILNDMNSTKATSFVPEQPQQSSPVVKTSSRYNNEPAPQFPSFTPSLSSSIEPNKRALKHTEIWNELFPGILAEFLPWDEFKAKVKHNPNIEALVYVENNERYFNCTEEDLQALIPYIKHNNNVSQSAMIKLFSWFSPIKARDDPHTSTTRCWKLEDVTSTIKLDYFYGWEDSTSLETKLKDAAPGTFLVRFSTRNPGGYAIVAKHGNVISWKVDPHDNCYLTMPCSSRPSYKNIQDIIEIHKTTQMPKIPITLQTPFSKFSTPAPAPVQAKSPSSGRYRNQD